MRLIFNMALRQTDLSFYFCNNAFERVNHLHNYFTNLTRFHKLFVQLSCFVGIRLENGGELI